MKTTAMKAIRGREITMAQYNARAKLDAANAASFEHGTFDDGISSNEDWSRNDTRGSTAPRYEEGVQLLHQLTYGPRLRPHRA